MTFRIIFEVEPPRVPDIKKVLRQVEIFGPIVDAILVPDNHLGQPALSSVVLALEVRNLGFKPIVAINARDRNLLRLRSDLLTLRAYEIEEVLLLYGDRIEDGRSTLTVRQMLEDESGEDLQKGVVAPVGKRLGWRERADYLFTKLDFGRSQAGEWRRSEGFDHPLYSGVIALSDGSTARRILANIPGLEPPTGYFEAFDGDSDAGFKATLSQLDDLESSGVDGAHLVVPTGRARFAEMLEGWVGARR